MIRPDDGSLSPVQLANVQRHADRLLREAGAYGRFPTPVADLLAAAKLTVVEDELLDEGLLRRFLRRTKSAGAALKSALGKLLGLFDAQDRVVLIDRGVPRPKKPFVKLHEAGHGFLPHQSGLFAVIHDCEKTLDPDTTDLFEREANVFASETLFQRDAFSAEANDEAFGIRVPMRLAARYGASNYSAFRRYVTESPRACCVVVLEPSVQGPDGGFEAPIRRVVASESFARMFDTKSLLTRVDRDHPIGHVVPIGRRMTARREVVLRDRNGADRQCFAEAFDTKHQTFVLVVDNGPVSRSVLVKPGSATFKKVARRIVL
ncbi:ImmA/IrrE family metallo-endopeptidase [Roseomonas mucosa]|uniref:ImmA/IrrE family metallo-endopeptidase n=1 Tax=Roseomonas mucosa TaxID=207340 RepID=UPI0022479E25|nr:ImmA/IrrE family metallo-endopeptidase [Roseomonas mucosa]UZO94600.1 Hypothetical protein RMP42_05895 [Roseomonas mucosa]